MILPQWGVNPHCGSPLNWRDTAEMTWEGRQLVSHKDLTGNVTTTYAYNSEGIRTQRKVVDLTSSMKYALYKYTLDGTKILSQFCRSTILGEAYTLYFLYDESGSVIGFNDGTNTYYYQKNIQGDIIRILDVNGNVVVEYTYDAWGKVLSVTGSLADTIGQKNPFRYRSYYYDSETGWYYLNSRYYDPEVGRFLNADEYVSTGQGILGYNMFAYCNNNPVMNCDPTGYSPALFESYGVAAAAAAAAADGPLPFGDLIAGIILVAVIAVTAEIAPNTTVSPNTNILDDFRDAIKSKSKDDELVITKDAVTDATKEETEKNKKTPYYAADLERNILTGRTEIVVKQNISMREACTRVKAGLSVMCDDAQSAYQLVFGIPTIVYEIDCGKESIPGYYYHFHISYRHGDPHIWHYGPPDVKLLEIYGGGI